MVSAAGSGELLFTPRVGSLYGYTLIWALFAAVMFKWFINREIGRYTVCTRKTILDGFAEIHVSLVYLILVPQLFVAVATIAGLAGSSATALVIMFPGDIRLWTIAAIILSTVFVSWGRFRMIELVATILAIVLSLSAITAALIVFPGGEEFVSGFIPKVGKEVKIGEVLPWLGFMLSGAAGMIWYSYWIKEKGYGASGIKLTKEYSASDKKNLRGWIRQMTYDNNLAVFGTLIITLSFLILGAELLRPQGLVPEENKVAEVLGRILGELWGPIGFWFMVISVFIGFWDTVLSDQDGFGRMFTGGTRRIVSEKLAGKKWMREETLKRIFVIVLCAILPTIVYLFMGEPVKLLQIAGAIEAAHIPVLVVLVLALNYKRLPAELRPSLFVTVMTAFSGLFFAAFTIIYIGDLAGWFSIN